MNLPVSVFCDSLLFMKRFDFDRLQMSSRRLRSIVERHLHSCMRRIRTLTFDNMRFDVSRQLLYRLVENFKVVVKL